MKPTDRDPNFWTPKTEQEETWAHAIAALAVFVIVLIAGYLWYITLWAAQ